MLARFFIDRPVLAWVISIVPRSTPPVTSDGSTWRTAVLLTPASIANDARAQRPGELYPCGRPYMT